MVKSLLLKKSQYQLMPWKNGLGTTEQIDIFPIGTPFPGNDFFWRLSSARVGTDSDFSNFPGCDRLLVVWKGEGLFLNEQKLPPFEGLRFSGETQIHCRLIQGEVMDLGLIYRRDQVVADLHFHEVKAGKDLRIDLDLGVYYLFCAQGEFTALGKSVEAGDTLKIEDGDEAINVLSTKGAKIVLLRVGLRA